MKNKQRSMYMSVSSLQLRRFMTCTADSLSDLVRMCFPVQSWPHTMHEAMIGIISFTAMDWESSAVLSLHGIWSQRLLQKVLYCNPMTLGRLKLLCILVFCW